MSLILRTARELRHLIREGEVHPAEIVAAFSDRIRAIDPEIKAFLTLDEHLSERKPGNPEHPPQTGGEKQDIGFSVPIALKDNFYTADMPTTAGSRMLDGFIPDRDAQTVTRLRAAGIPIVGKTNMDEFAMGPSTENSAYWPTRNPWDRNRVPGGSSGGSAAAVAAHLVPWALGSDTGGSVRQPAAFCGVVGLKPTHGLIPADGMVPLVAALDCVGVITKDVADASLLLDILTNNAKAGAPGFYQAKVATTPDRPHRIAGVKIGVPLEYIGEGIDPEVKDAVTRVAVTLEEMGAHVEEMSLRSIDSALPAYYVISSLEIRSVLAKYGEMVRTRTSPDFHFTDQFDGPSPLQRLGLEAKWRMIFGGAIAHELDPIPKFAYRDAENVREMIRMRFKRAFDRWDVLLGPTTPGSAFPLGAAGFTGVQGYTANLLTIPINMAGLPAISVPCGLDKRRLPLGVQFIGRPWQEGTILQVAHAYEQARGKNDLALREELPRR